MAPAGGGNVRTVLTAGGFDIPYQGDANQISTFQPANFCVVKGDYIDLNDSGGWGWNPAAPDNFDGNLHLDPQGQPYPHQYQDGAPFKIFGSVAGSDTAWFTGDGQTAGALNPLTGAPLSPPPTGKSETHGVVKNTELLMQYKLATGTDVATPCKNYLTGTDPNGRVAQDFVDSLPAPTTPVVKPPKDHPMLIWSDLVGVKRSNRVFSPQVWCPRGSPCTGTAVVTVKGKASPPVPFTAPPGVKSRIKLTLSRSYFRLLRIAKSHRLKITLTLTSQHGVATHVMKLWS
jgi:hypothetical protein